MKTLMINKKEQDVFIPNFYLDNNGKWLQVNTEKRNWLDNNSTWPMTVKSITDIGVRFNGLYLVSVGFTHDNPIGTDTTLYLAHEIKLNV